ncbi:MAG: hypothetical protein JWP69_488 [Flaviaesturariibacter sp.]|nr:hypothetical protein [Flaviaesturariibacter sp.]
MKYISKIFFLLTLAVAFVACNKVEDLPVYKEGTSVTLTSSATAVVATQADSSKNVVTFFWTNPAYASDSGTYKYIIQIDSATRNFSKAVSRTVTGTRSASFTGKDLNAILLDYGFAVGVPYKLDVRVISSYGNNNERYMSNVVSLMVTPYNDPSTLTASATSVTGTLATSSQNSLTFSWTRAFSGYSGAVTYTLQYDSAGKNFVAPLEMPFGSVFSKTLTQAEVNTTALNSGIAGGASGKVEYRIKATTAAGAISYSNVTMVTVQTYVPLLRFYMPGGYQGATGNGNDWDPGTAPEFIRDLRPGSLNKLYYMYIFLPAGSEFKITQGRDWAINYGGSGGNLSSSGGNLSVATAGVYRVSIDVVNMKYDIRLGRMGFVGGATGAGWDPPSVFPNYALGYGGRNLFVGITNFTVDGWKLIDNNAWNNGSNTLDETRSYGSTGGSGSSLVVNDANMPNITTAGRYRVIWDGRDPNNVKYEMSPATEMRIVGNGMQGVPDWNPGASPQMTYMGAGKWQATVTLVAGKEFKFLAANDWGAFDYEDNSGGSTATGVARKIKWEGGDNFKTPTVTGSYTIVLDENAQTVTIN